MARDIMTTITNLLAKANNSACTPAEAEAFAAKAQELMTTYQVEVEIGIRAGAEREKIGTRFLFRQEKGQRLIKARRQLWFALADMNSCRVVVHGANGRAGATAFGHESDLTMVEAMYASLLIQMHTALAAAQNAGEVTGTSGPVSYAHGWVARVVTRLAHAKVQAMDTNADANPGTSLVLVDRTAVVKEHIDTVYPKLHNVKMGTSIKDHGAYGAGDRDGRNANLGGSAVGSTGNGREVTS